jgi:hypothetical protein
MLAEIVLSVGTDRVTIRDIPALFATAIHPALPDDTPRQVTELKKYPLTEDCAANWCGVGVTPFEVRLTNSDWVSLASGVWAHLAPLSLPIPEAEWEPYRIAFERTPPTDWRLLVTFENPVTRQRVLQHTVANDYRDIVRKAAINGQLKPRSSTTLLPLPAATGELLLDCFIPLDELRVFASQFGVGVKFAPEFTQSPRPLAIDPALLALKPTDMVVVHSAIGSFSGKSWGPAKDYIEVTKQTIARQNDGFFTVGEAAQVIADSRSGMDVKDMIQRISGATVKGHRLVRNPDRLPLRAEDDVREFLDLVKVSDIDVWLTDLGAGYLFPKEGPGATAPLAVTTESASGAVKPETPAQRRARWLDWYGRGERGAVQRVYERERLLNSKADRSFIGKEIGKAKKEKAETKRGGAMFGQLVRDGKRES